MAHHHRRPTGVSAALANEPPIFHAIKRCDYEEVFGILKTDPDALKVRNADGATPVHVSFLLSQYDLGKALMQAYPEHALLTYAEGPYAGENVLHITIIQRQYDVFKWLLEHFPLLLDARTGGKFFKPGGNTYFGGYPLLFAVSTNQSRMVQDILDTPVRGIFAHRINCADDHGNNALHMCVIHNLSDMFHFILSKENIYNSELPLLDMANREGLTPLSLAAAMGRVHLFKLILTHKVKTAWVYGPVLCKLMPLRGLDQPYLIQDEPKVYKKHASSQQYKPMSTTVLRNPLALYCMSAGRSRRLTECLPHEVPEEVYAGRLALGSLPEIRQLLDEKWEHFGRSLFMKRFIPLLVVMILWTIAIILPNSYTEDPENLSEYPVSNGFIIAFESCVLAFVVWTVIAEVLKFIHSGLSYFKGYSGVVAVMYWLRTFFCLFVLILVGLRAGQQYNPQIVFTALGVLIGWLWAITYLVALKSTGPFVLVVKELIMEDVRRFAVIWLIIVMGFTTAIYLTRAPNEDISAPVWFWQTFRDVIILGTVGEFLLGSLNDGPCPWLLNLLIVLYLFIQILVILSIFVATVSITYESCIEESECRFYMERSNLMAYFESEYNIVDMFHKRLKYATPLAADLNTFDADLYLQVLTTDEDWKHEVRLEQQHIREVHKRNQILAQEQSEWECILAVSGTSPMPNVPRNTPFNTPVTMAGTPSRPAQYHF